MQHMDHVGVVHGDLAARNCLVGDRLTVKVSDLGVARSLYADDYCCLRPGDAAVPLRWMAWESVVLVSSVRLLRCHLAFVIVVRDAPLYIIITSSQRFMTRGRIQGADFSWGKFNVTPDYISGRPIRMDWPATDLNPDIVPLKSAPFPLGHGPPTDAVFFLGRHKSTLRC